MTVAPPPDTTAPYFDLGSYRRSIDTPSAEARIWFDRGLVWAYAFNHDEAVRCFERALDRVKLAHPRAIDLSLGRVCALLAKLGNPQRRLAPVVHVAGTNGKGSTIAVMRAVLEEAGYRVQVFTSPHLVRFNERIRLVAGLIGGHVNAEELEQLPELFARCAVALVACAVLLALLTPVIKRMLKGNPTVDPAGADASAQTNTGA